MGVSTTSDMFSQLDVRETITNTSEVSVAWNTDYARYDGVFDTTLGDANNVFISPEGTEIYITEHNGGGGTSNLRQYTLSTPWNITTATLTRTLDIDAAGRDDKAADIFFTPDGLKMYVLGTENNRIYEYSLSTAWDISTTTYVTQSPALGGEDGVVTGMYIREDGKQVFMCGTAADKIHQYIMSTAWDISSMELVEDVAFTPLNPDSLFFSRDGVYAFITNNGGNLHRWDMTSVFKISTATTDKTFASAPAGTVVGVAFSTVGTKMYLLLTDGKIQEYTIKRGWR